MADDAPGLDLSFVVIGFNEAAHLGACLASVRAAHLDGLRWELIYVDGGSTDQSRELAAAAPVDRQLGGERRRKAAENRNLGLASARGRYVQFLDGDMVLDAAWPKVAIAVLERDVVCAAVCGVLEERNKSAVYQALQLDWEAPEGPIPFCGGAAMFRGELLAAVGGFPEDVAYGEEPYLCWRIRNEYERTIWHLPVRMALHDLAYKGFADYWRRSARTGETYAEIAARCRGTKDPLWSAEVRSNLVWSAFYFGVLFWMLLMFVDPNPLVRFLPVIILSGVLLRKANQRIQTGTPRKVALLYAAHTYFAKLNIGYGIVRWHLRRARR